MNFHTATKLGPGIRGEFYSQQLGFSNKRFGWKESIFVLGRKLVFSGGSVLCELHRDCALVILVQCGTGICVIAAG